MSDSRRKKATLTLTYNSSQKAGDENPMCKIPSPYQEEKNILISGDGELRPRGVCANRPC